MVWYISVGTGEGPAGGGGGLTPLFLVKIDIIYSSHFEQQSDVDVVLNVEYEKRYNQSHMFIIYDVLLCTILDCQKLLTLHGNDIANLKTDRPCLKQLIHVVYTCMQGSLFSAASALFVMHVNSSAQG